MKTYKKNYLNLSSDFQINILRSLGEDEDLMLNLDSRVVNLVFQGLRDFPVERFQLTEVKNILIRHSLDESISLGTLHFLRVIDLNSSLLNFSLDLRDFDITIKDEFGYVEVQIKKRP